MNILCRIGLHRADIYAVTHARAGETEVDKVCRRCGETLSVWVEPWKAGL